MKLFETVSKQMSSQSFKNKVTNYSLTNHTHTHIRICVCVCGLTEWLEWSPMARETGVQFQVKLYQRLKKWYLMAPFLNTQHYKVRIKVSGTIQGKE